MSATFTLTGERQFKARMAALGKAPRVMLGEVGIRAVEEAKRLVPRRTGNLARTIRIASRSDTHVEVRAGGDRKVGYAAVVELGSKRHFIRPRRAKALAWGGARTLGGRLRSGARAEFFSRGHEHPGTQPRPYLVPGLEKAVKFVGLDGLIRAWNSAA